VIDEEGEGEMPKPLLTLKVELKQDTEKVREQIAASFSENFQIAEDYTWSRGVEMDLFAPVEVEPVVFTDRKFRTVKDERYE
jgi:hypothetical protein